MSLTKCVPAWVACVLWLASGIVHAVAYEQDAGSDGLVVMEGENADLVSPALEHTWTVTNPGGVSGAAIDVTPNLGVMRNRNYVGNSPRLDFIINFNRTGVHYVWVRGIGLTSGDDTVHVGLNGVGVATADRIPGFIPTATWRTNTLDGGAVATLNIESVGEHTVNVWMREDGFRLDKLLLTSNPAYTPAGEGPAESPRGGGGPPTAATPTIAPDGGTFTDSQSVTLSSSTPDATIHFTVDGSQPTTSSAVYTDALNLTETTTVRVLAVAEGFNDSGVASATFTKIEPPSGDAYVQGSTSEGIVSMEAENAHGILPANEHTWTLTNPGGVSGAAMDVTPNLGIMRNRNFVGNSPRLDFLVNFNRTGTHYVWVRGVGLTTGDDSVHVGIDGVGVASGDRIPGFTPTATWRNNTLDGVVASVNVDTVGEHTINVWMREDGFRLDKLLLTSSASFVPTAEGPAESPRGGGGTPTVATPALSPNGGTFPNSVDVTLSTTTGGATIYYTTDGSDPTTSSMAYGGPFSLTETTEIRAFAVLADYNDSNVASATFTIETVTPTVATPTISPDGGTHIDEVEVTLATTTPGATLHFTTDGSAPTTASPVYGGPFTLTETTTVRVFGVLADFDDSAEASATFTVEDPPPPGSGYTQDTGSEGLVVMEAENADGIVPANEHTWTLTNPGGVSGAAMDVTPNLGIMRNRNFVGNSPRLDFLVNFNRTGTHYVWVRGVGLTTGDDSVHVGIDGVGVASADRIPGFTATASWRANTLDGVVATVNIDTVGEHTINVWMREDGFRLDKLLLTTSASYAPTGAGPAESPRGGGGGTPTVATPALSPNGGTFVSSVEVTLATTTGGATIYYTTDGSAPTTGSTVYSGPFTLTESAVVRSIAARADYNNSLEGSASFVINPPSGGGGGGYLQDAGSEGLVSIEAENADVVQPENEHTWTETSASGASGSVMDVTPNLGILRNRNYVGESPRMDYPIQFNRAGVHYVWLRGLAPSGFDDSVHVGLNGVETPSADRIAFFSSSLGWRANTLDGVVATVNVPSAGEHTLNVWMREDGFRLDKIVLTSSSSYVPTDNGPPESPRGASFVFADDVLRFTFAEGDTTPAQQMTSLSTTDDQMVAFTLSDDQPWLDITPVSGGTPSVDLSVSVNPTGLAAGVYQGEITATGAAAGAGSMTVEVYVAPALPLTRNFSSGGTSEFTFVSQSGDANAWFVGGGDLVQNGVSSATLHSFADVYTRGRLAVLNNTDGLVDFRASVEVVQTATNTEQQGLDVGLVFRMTGDEDFYRLAVNGKFGFTELVRSAGGTLQTLAVNARGYEIGQTLIVGVEAIGGVLRAYVADVSVGDVFSTAPVLTTYDTTHFSGSVAVYAQSQARFDNLSITAAPSAAFGSLANPQPFGVLSGTFVPVEVLTTGSTDTAQIDLQRDGGACGATTQTMPNVFSGTCAGATQGEHEITYDLRAQGGAVLESGSTLPIATLGEVFLTVGDSISNGWGDLYDEDNVGHGIQFGGSDRGPRMIKIRGYQTNLHDALEDDSSWTAPTVIFDMAVPGDTTDEQLVRLPSAIARYPGITRALVMLGTNDALSLTSPQSGLGCSGAACNNTYKGTLLEVVDTLQAAGITPMIAKMPPVFGAMLGVVWANPGIIAINVEIQGYNQAIDEVNSERGLTPGPDFYAQHYPPGEPRLTLSGDNLHPNSFAHRLMGLTWLSAITGAPQPLLLTDFCLELNNSGCEYPARFGDLEYYDQELLGVGDPYNVEKDRTLTSIPAILQDGIWVRTATAHRTNTRANYLRFDVDRSVDVYVAYPAGATVPTWLQSWTDTGETLGVSSATGNMTVYQRTFTGANTIQLGGASGAGSGGSIADNYLVVVQER